MASGVNLAFDADSVARLVKKTTDDPNAVLTATAGIGAAYVAYRILRAVVPLIWRLKWVLVIAAAVAGVASVTKRP